METSNPSSNKAIIAIVVVALIAIAATAVIVTTSGKDTNTSRDDATQQAGTTSDTTPNSTASTTNTTSATLKDGTYTATGSYQTPGGQESIGVTVTLSGNTITDATVTQNANGGEAAEFQRKFAAGYQSLVVGKKITDVSLTRVAGSSLTPIGFNNAISDIEDQARA